MTENEISKLLNKMAEALDIPDSMFEDATLKYQDVAEWLAAEDSVLKGYDPEIYPQGSFRLGTVVRPIFDRDEYDIDLVCRLRIDKANITQKDLKSLIGDRITKRQDLASKLDESRRCWFLTYPKQFHMDILPSIPNTDNPPNGILLTDTELKNWQYSNPIAYAEWFYECMKNVFRQRREYIAKLAGAPIEEVPDWQVRTSLQRAVQLLKRHRDIYFMKKKEIKPASIIITTLAGYAYGSQEDLGDALKGIIEGMASYVQRQNEKWWIQNPVQPKENFADKWNEKNELPEAFFNWLQAVRSDMVSAQSKSVREAVDLFTSAFGKDVVTKAASDFGINLGTSLITFPTEEVPALADERHCEKPTWLERITYKATIQASVHFAKNSKKKLWDVTGRPVSKNVWLKFKINTNVPYPYEVKWQVTNTGKEAIEAAQLRGDFYPNEGSDTRWEQTRFAGTHWVEGFIIKNSVCLARTGRKYIKIKK